MSRVDLHVHTNASDGRYSPAEVVRKAVQAGVSILGITDHDTVAGVGAAAEAAKMFPMLNLVPGVEINTDVPSGEAHILGYFVDCTHPELLSILVQMRVSRHDRARRMIAKLGALGMALSWERVQEIAKTDSIGRPHIAAAMLEKGYVSSFREAFDRYIGFGGPAYVERSKVSPGEAVELILRARGLPVLAHPLTVADYESMVSDLKQHGLVGIEVYYGCYSRSEVIRLRSLAQKYSLVTTGGSDFHGLDERNEAAMGQTGVPMRAAKALIALAELPTRASKYGGIEAP